MTLVAPPRRRHARGVWLWIQLIRRSWWVATALLLAATAYLRAFAAGSPLLPLHGGIVYGVAAAVAVALPRLAWSAIARRHAGAFEREDAAELRALARACKPGFANARLRGLAGSIQLSALMADERHAEVRDLCAEALRRPMPARHRAILNNALAWATAHAGDAEEAIPIARAALADGAALSPAERALCQGTLGIALVLGDRPAEAVAQLEGALAAGGTRRAQAIRAHYLGEGLRALGRAEEARAAYTRSIREQPASRWAMRARTARDTLGVAYR
jgi:tetratricopeptide (TPR) repeat protein